MSFVNSNYESKLSPTMTENWLVQIFKNDATSILTTATPNLIDKDDADYNLRFSFSQTTYNGYDYYPAILNKPSISYSLDLKGFTTKTGNINLNIANIDLDGTTLLELLGNEYINGHVNVLSQIDGDDTANNALQIFSGKVSSFGYRNNTIVLNVISNRPFQNVSIPQGRSENTDNTQYNNKIVPLVYGDYTPNTAFVSGTDVYACPFLKNDGKDFLYIVPEGTDGADTAKLEFYDKGLKRFLELINTDTTIVTEDTVSVLKVPKLMRRQFKMLPDQIDGGIVEQEGSGGDAIAVTFPGGVGTIKNMFDGDTGTEADINHATNYTSEARGFTIKLDMPQVTGKITAITLGLDGTITQSFSAGSPSASDGLFVNLATSLSSGFGSTSGDVEIIGTDASKDRSTSIDLTASYNAVDISSILSGNALPDELYVSFKYDTSSGNVDYNSWNASIENVFMTITAENDLDNEPIASQEFNAGIDKLYLGRDVTTPSFTEHTTATTIGDLNNPVAIHRELLHSIINVTDFTGDTDIENSGFKTVAELRDSTLTSPTSTHWKTRLALDEKESLESIMEQLQYEGCFFFEFSPQAQQTAISGVSGLRYFTIEDSVTANVDLSQNDISGYELGITSAQDLETRLLVNYKPHPAENEYLEQDTFTASTHTTIFGDADIQKQEINLDLLYDAVEDVVGSRNSSWINFRKSLFGDYKTTVNATLVNPEKYGMLQVGDYIDFGEITFEELGSPFNEISDTFDSYVSMPTRLFKDAWSGKKFIITNLKRQVGKVSVQCREV